MPQTTDRHVIELKRRLAGPDVEAIARTHFASVYATCLRITRNRHDAEDAAQAVFLCLSIQLRSGSEIRAMGPWLNQVARRAAVDACRRRKRRDHYESAFAAERIAGTVDAEKEPDWAELRPAVVAALNELPAKYRLPLILHYFGGMEQQQLAAELSCSRVNLRVRMHRGHKMLRDLLQRRGVQLAGGMLVAALADAVQHQVSQSLVGASAAQAGQLSVTAYGGAAGMMEMAGGGSLVRVKVLLAALLGIAAISAATAPLLAKLKGEWQEIPWRPQIEFVPDLPKFTAPLPLVSEVPQQEEAPTQAGGNAPTGGAAARFPSYAAAIESGAPIRAAATPPGSYSRHAARSGPPLAAAGVTPPLPAVTFRAPVASSRVDDAQSEVQVRHHRRPHQAVTHGAPAIAYLSTVPAHDTVWRRLTHSGNGSYADSAALHYTAVDSYSAYCRASVGYPVDLLSNGQVIADGVHRDYSYYNGIINTKENSEGVNGWFAVNRGSITLPPIRLTRGENWKNWGESESDRSIDLINSMTIVADAPSALSISISLLATDHPLVPQLPSGHHFVGIWKMDGGAGLTSGLDLTIRYDDTRLTHLGLDESLAKLWYYGAGGWTRVTDASFVRNTVLNQVSGHVPAAGFYGVSTPEPTGAMFVIFAGAGALLRRRR